MMQVKTLDVRSRQEWRNWLREHHDSVPEIWLIFHKRHTGLASLSYDDAVEEALRNSPPAWRHFQQLAPSYRRAYIGWIESAKREETKKKRLNEALSLLAAGKKLGLK